MIVNCPKCEFEQPIDEYCAQCGAPLRKLVELEKLKKQNSSNLPIFMATFAFFVVAGAWLFLQFNNNKVEKLEEAQTILNEDTSKVVVSLKSAKIKVNRNKSEPLKIKGETLALAAKPFAEKAKSFPKIKNQGLDSFSKPNPERKESAVKTQNTIIKEKPLKLSKLSVISTKNCDFNIETGSTDKDFLAKLRNCSSVITTRQFNNNGEIIEQGESFETILNWSIKDGDFLIDASFNSETSEGAQSENSNLNIEETTKGFIINNPFIDLVDRDNLKEDAKTNILNSSLFGFSQSGSQVYFLLSE